MIEQEIVESYLSGCSMRSIALKCNTNHKLISRVLKRNGVETRLPQNKRGQRKFDCKKKLLYNNMQTHLRFDVELDWLLQFEDIEKLKTLNRCVTSRDNRFNESSRWYVEFIEKFYNDEQFNSIYNKWMHSGKQKYFRPSVDHILPKAKGGTNAVDNLQILSWFENRCKNDMSQEDWNILKNNIQEYFIQ